ncbi:MAG: PilZ domain-containing protein [Clostridia bacterium]|nr:PilZ domain-containing protein [Clostridia bacterium]
MEQERRKHRRLDLDATLIMKRLDDGSQEKVRVDVLDLSKTGIGFKCAETLDKNAVYQAELKIWTKEIIYTFVNITRIDDSQSERIYGATFVGMPETDACKIAIYEMFDDAEHGKL